MSAVDTGFPSSDWVPLGIAASLTGLSARTLRKLVEDGQITAERLPTGRWMVALAALSELRASVTIGEACRASGRSEDVIRLAWDRGDLAGFRTASGQRRIYRDSLAAYCEGAAMGATTSEFNCPICRAQVPARRTAVDVDGRVGATEWRCAAGHLSVVVDDEPGR